MITYCGITHETCFSQNVFGTHLCTSSLIPSSNNMKLKYISKYIEEKVKLASNQPQSSLVDNSSARFDEILKRISDLEERKYSIMTYT